MGLSSSASIGEDAVEFASGRIQNIKHTSKRQVSLADRLTAKLPLGAKQILHAMPYSIPSARLAYRVTLIGSLPFREGASTSGRGGGRAS